jgi:pyruvate/2-oxoglutarate dehydrogenase complex dihydrolipoamide acyltransferase (E2) component
MLMKLEFPLLDRSLRGGRVVGWQKREGERFDFGEVICLTQLDEFAALRRTGRATLLSGKRRTSLKSDLEIRDGKVALSVALTASDSGWVHTIIAQEGTEIGVGSLLAVVSTDGRPGTGRQPDEVDMPLMRVVANVVDTDETDLNNQGWD